MSWHIVRCDCLEREPTFLMVLVVAREAIPVDEGEMRGWCVLCFERKDSASRQEADDADRD
jgi:hypothetical protein